MTPRPVLCYACYMPASHPADAIQATCLMCAPERESTVEEWKRMLWTLAFMPVPVTKEN